MGGTRCYTGPTSCCSNEMQQHMLSGIVSSQIIPLETKSAEFLLGVHYVGILCLCNQPQLEVLDSLKESRCSP